MKVDFGAVVALDGLGSGAELGHGRAEGAEVVYHSLVDEDIAVGEEEDAFLTPGFPQAPDDLEGGIGFAGAGGHDQEDAILRLGDGFDGDVDGVALVVARRLAAGVFEVILEDDGSASGVRPFQARYLAQRSSGEGKLSRDRSVSLCACAGAIVEQKAVAVEEKTKGISRVAAYSRACCMPSPTLWLLSLASIMAMGILGL